MVRCRLRNAEGEAWRVGSDDPLPDWVVSVVPGERGRYRVLLATNEHWHNFDKDDVLIKRGDGIGLCHPLEFERKYEVIDDVEH